MILGYRKEIEKRTSNLIICPRCKKVLSLSKFRRHTEKRCSKEPRNHWHANVGIPNEWQLAKESSKVIK